MKHFLATVVAALAVFVSSAHAVLKVSTTVTTTDGIRAQGVIVDPTSIQRPGAPTLTAVAIKEITASILIRDSLNIDNGLQLVKHNLTPAQAYGLGQTNGYDVAPFTNSEGPWNGLQWPYRDQYDYFPGPFDPLGNDVGNPFDDQPGVYGFVNVAGISRGGPTDPVGEPGSSSPSWLLRGETGNGLTGPASYFNFDIDVLEGPSDRTVRLQIFAASAKVVLVDSEGNYSEQVVPIEDFTRTIALPEPGSVVAAGSLILGALVRRRRCAA